MNDTKYCHNCGQAITADSKFCSSCGAAQDSASQANNANNSGNSAPTSQPTEEGSDDNVQFLPKRHLCKEAKALFFINYLFRTSILLPLLLVGIYFDPLVFSILLLGYLLVLYLIAALMYQNFYYSIDHTGFQKEYGIIHKQHVSIPYEQIQNVNIYRSPVDQILNLARINVESAGSSSDTARSVMGVSSTRAEGHLPGVTPEEAKRIHELLLKQMAEAQ